MPKIPVPTAQGQNQVGLRQFGVMTLPTPQPESYGAGVGRGMQTLADAMFRLDAHLQDQRDKLDLSEMSLQFSQRLDAAKHAVLTDPEIDFTKKPDALAEQTQKIVEDVSKIGRSSNARTAFTAWTRGEFGKARLEVVHEGRRQEAQNQIIQTDKINEGKIDRAAQMPLTGFDTKNTEVFNIGTEVKDLLNSNVANGLRTPMEVEKERDRLFNRYWEQRAQNDPLTIMRLAAEGKPVENMDMQKMGHYLAISYGVMDKIRLAQERELKQAQDANIKNIEGIMWGNENGPGRDATQEIEAVKGILTGEQYENLRKDNKTIENMRFEITNDRKRLSEFSGANLLELARRAKFEPDLLKTKINNDIVREHVFKYRDLLPDDAAPILAAINEARTYHEREDSGKRRGQTEAMQSLNVFVPQNMDPMEQIALKNQEDSMKREFRAELERNPDASAAQLQEIADNIRARGEKRIVGLQKLKLKDVDEELFGMEQLWKSFGENIVGSNHEIDAAKRKDIEQRFPLMRGMFRLHDERRQRWEQLKAPAQDVAAEGAKQRGK